MAVVSPDRAMGGTATSASREGHGDDRRPIWDEVGAGLGRRRAISMVGAVGLFWPLFSAWKDVVSVPGTGLAAIAMLAGTLVLCCLIATARSTADLERLDRWLLVLGALTVLAVGAATLSATSGYSTDEAAFTQAAAKLMLHGHDPYGADLVNSLFRYSVPARFWTYTMGGGYVTAFGYPALPLLLSAPFVWLTGDGQGVAYAGLAGLIATMLVAYRLLPRDLRALSVVACVAFPSLAGFATSGLTIVLSLPFLLLVARRWSGVGRGAALSRQDVVCALALGLALCTNQLSWLLAPFVVGGIYRLRQSELGHRAALQVAVRYLVIAVGAFAVVNLPFVLWGPGAWLGAVAAPLTQHALPYGQGLVGLTAFLHLGGGAVDAYSAAGALLLLGLLAVFLLDVRRLAGCCFLFPLLALFVSGRSLGEYWMALVPVVLVSLFARSGEPPATGGGTGSRPVGARPLSRPGIAAGLLVLPAIGCLALALLTPAPLRIQVSAAHSDPVSDVVDRLTLQVHNESGTPLVPHFSTDDGGQASAFWTIVSGPSTIRPHASARVVLSVPAGGRGPSNGARFLVQAVSDGPRTISTSPGFAQPGPVVSSW